MSAGLTELKADCHAVDKTGIFLLYDNTRIVS